jgi:hypothetical protein
VRSSAEIEIDLQNFADARDSETKFPFFSLSTPEWQTNGSRFPRRQLPLERASSIQSRLLRLDPAFPWFLLRNL